MPTFKQCLALLALGLTLQTQAAPTLVAGVAPSALLPQPQSLEVLAEAPPFVIDRSVQIDAADELAGPARYLAKRLGLKIMKTAGDARSIRFVLDPSVGAVDGAYRLKVNEAQIEIAAAGPNGAFYGAQTLLQMLPPGRIDLHRKSPSLISVPSLNISDAPRFAWRGQHIDVARHFFGVAEIKSVLDNMAAYKLNRLHLHLTDDSGWRLQIKGYPKLTQIGARGDWIDPKSPRRFFTAADIRELVRYAEERRIEIIPEIEMPGHAGAASRAYPEFFVGASFNPAKPETYAFIEAVIGQVTRLFPGQHLHFGGDELDVESAGWGQRPEIVALARQLNPKSEAPDLKAVEAEFARRVAEIIRSHDRMPIGWDEVFAAGFQGDAIVQFWRVRDPALLVNALSQGRSVILSPTDRLYFDYAQGPGEPGAPFAGDRAPAMSSERIVAWEPVPATLSADQASHVLGIEACLWTEFVRSPGYLQYMLYPRMAAVAEVAWRAQPNGTPAEFTKRLAPHIARWRALGVNVRGDRSDIYKVLVH